MRCEVKHGLHDGFLFVIKSLLMPNIKTYILAEGGSITAYGQCPVLGLESLGRDRANMDYRECVDRIALAADDGYEIDGGKGMPIGLREKWTKGIDKFFCHETAELASAVAGWPAAVTIFPAEKDRK